MKMKQLFLITLLLIFAAAQSALAQSGTLSGTVTDQKDSVVQGASVTLRRGAEVFTTTTNAEGKFVFNNLPGDNRTLTINANGFELSTQEVSAGGDLQIKLNVANVVTTVVVQTEVDSYLADTSTTGTKLDLPQRDIPQAISVVPRSVFQDRVLVRLTETADNVAGARSLTGYGGTKANNYILRGFVPSFTTSNTLRNGFSEYTFLTQRDPVNVERLEFLKGPASLLYGSNEVGGIVNAITKKPLTEHRFELGFTGGGFRMIRPTVDATGPLNKSKSLLYRVNFAFEDSESSRDLVEYRNAFLAPSLTWKINDRTALTTELELGRFDYSFDSGFPSQPEFLNEAVNKNYGEPFSNALNRNLNLMLNLTHQINDKFSFRLGFNHVRSRTLLDSTGFGFFALQADRRTINRGANDTDEYSENYNSQNEFYARFSTGKVRHQLVAGFEFARFQFKYRFDQYNLAPIDRINPVYGATRGTFRGGFNDDSSAKQFGIYVQDQIEVLSNLKILVGGRASFVDAVSKDFPAGTIKNEQSPRKFTPRVGVVYQPTQTTSLYASFAESFAPNFSARSSTNEQFKPTTGRLYEAGVKQNFLNNRILATLSVYQLTRSNVLVPDLLDPFFRSIQTGEQRSRGVEIEVNGQVARGLNLNATYAAVEAEVTKDTRANFIGDQLVGVPKHSGGIYGNYVFDSRLLRGFSTGAGLYLASERFASLPNPVWRLPSYGRVDLNFGYRRENWRFDLAVKNLNNVRYFETGGFNTFLPQAKRHALASVTYSF